MKKNYYAKALALTVAASMVSVPAFAAEGTDDPQAQEEMVEQDEQKGEKSAEEDEIVAYSEEEQGIANFVNDDVAKSTDYASEAAIADAKETYGQEENEKFWYAGSDHSVDSVYLYVDGTTLKVVGDGAMKDWKDPSKDENNEEIEPSKNPDDYRNMPWYDNLANITEVNIAEGITHIGNDVFNVCRIEGASQTVTLTLPSTMETIGFGAFCMLGVESVQIPENVTEIKYSAFYGCANLAKVEFKGNKLLKIGDYSFAYCTSLKMLELPEGLKTIGKGFILGDDSIETIVFPESLTTINSNTFDGLNNLKNLTIKSAIAIPESAFRKKSKLETVNLGNAVTKIGNYAFIDCTSLKTIEGMQGVTEIGEGAFNGCTSLKSITIPASVTSIGSYALSTREKGALSRITFEGTTMPEMKTDAIACNPNLADVDLTKATALNNLNENSFVYWDKTEVDTNGEDTNGEDNRNKKFTTFYVSDSEKLTTLMGIRTEGARCGFADTNGGTLTGESKKGKLADLTKEGYTFDGWYKDTGFTNKVENNVIFADDSSMPSSNQTYYAKWVSEISLDANGGTVSGATVKVVEGAAIGTLPTPTKEGYTFGGWYTAKGNGIEVTAETVPTGNTTYYARWTKEIDNGEGKVTYYVNPIVGDVVYTGAGLNPAIEVYKNGTKIENTTEYTVDYANNTNVGVATATVKVGGVEIGTANFNIIKATPTITISPSVTAQRGAGTVTLTVTKPEKATGAVTVQCDNGITVDPEDGVYTAALPNATRTYTFTASYAGDANYNAAENTTCTVNVTRKKSSSSSSDTSAPTYGVSTGKTENGEISVTPAKAEAGETVTIKATPDSGYQLDKMTVKDKNNSTVKLKKADDNEYTFTMPVGKVSVDATFVQKDAADDSNAAEAGKTIKLQIGSRIVNVDNEAVIYDAAPVIRNDRTLVPIRIITEALGGKVDWNGATKEVTLSINDKEIKMTIGKTLEKYGVAPVIIDGRTFVPVRFVADELGAEVAWDEATKTVTIKTAR